MTVEELQKRLDTAFAALEASERENERLEAALEASERNLKHWRANHDNVAAKLRIATQRPDLPVDRIPAIKELERLQTENTDLRARLKNHEN